MYGEQELDPITDTKYGGVLLMLPLTKANSKSSGNGESRTGDVCLRLWEYDGAGIKKNSSRGRARAGGS